MDFFNKAIALYERAENDDGKATALNNIGSRYSSSENQKTALDFFDRALALDQKLGDLEGYTSRGFE